MEDQRDKFAIHAACREGKVTLVESLLNADQKLAKLKDDDGRLPIHWAASFNQVEIVRLLVQVKGFDPDVQDDSGWTPLMIAASVKDAEPIVDLLLSRGADVNEKSEVNVVPPDGAVTAGRYIGLVSDDEHRIWDADQTWQTVLHFVASKSNLDVAKKLLDRSPPASARVRDKRGQYALHRAAAVGSAPMVNLLLKHQSPLNATDSSGQTALHHAVAEGHGDTAVALLKAGAETDKKDREGCLALDLAPDKEVGSPNHRVGHHNMLVYRETD
ncbi:proteasome regulatory particle subunit [Niveomyces insectorum RCEF 264]|uniref:Proteasome regulatory particle subunit n=1 Tax=Niveomyces insectorum RCEF 264 TaxID=1081102 RepID=A0A167U1E6_9HYPO|nr:proteasome regulatory particle subunit [Niveomyces insectorum RCEF 264]